MGTGFAWQRFHWIADGRIEELLASRFGSRLRDTEKEFANAMPKSAAIAR